MPPNEPGVEQHGEHGYWLREVVMQRQVERERRNAKCRAALSALVDIFGQHGEAASLRPGARFRLLKVVSDERGRTIDEACPSSARAQNVPRSPAAQSIRSLINKIEQELASIPMGPVRRPDAIHRLGHALRGEGTNVRDGVRELLIGADEYVDNAHPIFGGMLESARTEVWVGEHTPLLYSLLKIPNERDVLQRETHGFGWHYHYCKKDGDRSDVVLTFRPNEAEPNPLYWEFHAERNADFQARVGAWGAKKRASIYQTCRGDAGKRSLSDYRRPGADAAILAKAPGTP